MPLHYVYLIIAQSVNTLEKCIRQQWPLFTCYFDASPKMLQASLNTLLPLFHNRRAKFSRISKPFMRFHEMVSCMRHPTIFPGNV